MAILLFAVLLVFPAGARAQQDEPAPATEPAVLPAEALSYGAELEKHASPKLLDWARKHARDLLRDEFTANELSAASIAKLFPAQPANAQETVRFLVGYEVYRRSSSRQESRAAYLRDLDRDIEDLDHRIRMVEATGAPTLAAAENRNAALANGQRRREQLEIQRRLAASSEEVERKRVDTALRWLAEAHSRVKDTPVEILRAVPAPRT